MTDKKTIQEALAEVQRNVEMKEFATGPAFKIAKFGAKQMAATGVLAGAAAAASSPKVREKASELYNKGKKFVSHTLGTDKTPEQSAASLNAAGQKISDTVTSAKNAVTGATTNPPTSAPTTPKPAETKTETKPADKPVAYDKNKYAIYSKDSDSAKSFRDTFAAQKAAGAETFKWKGGDEVERTYSTKSAPEQKKSESESGGKKKMSEENINELSAFGSAFAAAHKAGKTNFTFGGKSYNTRLASDAPTKTASPQGAPGLRGPGAGTGGPVARVRDLSAPLPPRRPDQGPPAPKAGSSNETLPIGSGSAPRAGVGEPGGQTSSINAPQTKPTPSGGSSNPPTTSGDVTPKGSSSFMSQNAREPESESGGKKKKMSEETNPLIASFLALQAKNPSNMFEAAKKLTKKQDEKLDVVDDDKIDAKDFAALRAGKKKVDEAVLKDPKDPSVQGSGDVTMEPAKPAAPAAAPVHVKPTNPEKLKNLKDPRDPSVQGSGDVTYKEEVTFSQAEIDHINSFFLEASVAPNRPEVATGADSTSDKMSQNDVTGTAESGKRIRKEEIELDEGDLSVGGLYDRLVDHLNGENPSRQKAAAVEKAITKVHGEKVMGHLRKAVNANRAGNFDGEMVHIDNARTAAGKSDRIGATVGSGRSEFRRTHEEVEIHEGRPKKNPTPETTERDPRQHIQVAAGRAAAGSVVDFPHNDGTKSKITPGMGRKITAHLNGLKPADRQAAVNKMHASAEGLKV